VIALSMFSLTLGVVAVIHPRPAQAATVTTMSFSGHEDDDLLFMNPDIASDVQAGYNVWVVYLTAGQVPARPPDNPGGLEYADMRIQGERAAYARAARVPNNWVFEQMTFGGHPVATNRLVGTNVHLVFTFISAANEADACGDLYKMWHNPNYIARPIDGRPVYTKASFVGMLRSMLTTIRPDYIRTQSTIGHRQRDHVDHVAGALLVADADADKFGNTMIRRDEYLAYIIANYPDNVFGYWQDEKRAIWNKYVPEDPEVDETSWQNVMGKQYRPLDRIFYPGARWVPPPDFNSCILV
jgi:LmbE family N-acetylglucosaminyl deacetylase